jgi:hypothetical protein
MCASVTLTLVPGAARRVSGALLNRDLSRLGIRDGPGFAVHRFAIAHRRRAYGFTLHRARDKSQFETERARRTLP